MVGEECGEFEGLGRWGYEVMNIWFLHASMRCLTMLLVVMLVTLLCIDSAIRELEEKCALQGRTDSSFNNDLVQTIQHHS